MHERTTYAIRALSVKLVFSPLPKLCASSDHSDFSFPWFVLGTRQMNSLTVFISEKCFWVLILLLYLLLHAVSSSISHDFLSVLINLLLPLPAGAILTARAQSHQVQCSTFFIVCVCKTVICWYFGWINSSSSEVLRDQLHARVDGRILPLSARSFHPSWSILFDKFNQQSNQSTSPQCHWFNWKNNVISLGIHLCYTSFLLLNLGIIIYRYLEADQFQHGQWEILADT